MMSQKDYSPPVFNMEFLSAMSHELRTPLNAILSLVDLLEEKMEDSDNRYLKDSLRYSTHKLLIITNEILDFASLHNSKLKLEAKQADLRNALQEVLAIHKNYFKVGNLTFEWLLDENLNESYELDVNRLIQILESLLSNALKFTKEGGVRLEVNIKAKGVDSDLVCFSVIDSGDGIKPEYLEKMFDGFTYLQSVTVRANGGIGLGLTIARGLLALFGSKIEVESIPGIGSRFHFDVELKKGVANISNLEMGIKALRNKSCLLVEDNELNTFVTRTILNRWGIKVELAVNGVEAVAKAFKKRYDFILMDIHMPEMNGYDATQIIRQQKNMNQRTPVFALTADITAAETSKLGHYFDDFLLKPLEEERLCKALLTGLRPEVMSL